MRYDTPVSDRFFLALQTNFRYQSEMFRDAENDPLTRADAHFLVDARIAMSPQNRRWEAAVWGKNLTDETFVYSGFSTPILGLATLTYNAPRTVGISFSWRM
jgi:iron complex outermembrane receptor protein